MIPVSQPRRGIERALGLASALRILMSRCSRCATARPAQAEKATVRQGRVQRRALIANSMEMIQFKSIVGMSGEGKGR
jgi:hypothetical protein